MCQFNSNLQISHIYMIDSNWSPFQILRSMADLLVRVGVRALDIDLRKREMAIFLGIWCIFEKGHWFELWMPIWKKDVNLRYRCLWRRNWTWIWGLDIDYGLDFNLSLSYIYIYLVLSDSINIEWFRIVLQIVG